DNNPAQTGLAAPIQTAGFTPLYIGDISTQSLAVLSMLVINEEDNAVVSSALNARLPAIETWIRGGGRVIIHDRATGDLNPNPLLIGATTSNCVRFTTSDID